MINGRKVESEGLENLLTARFLGIESYPMRTGVRTVPIVVHFHFVFS